MKTLLLFLLLPLFASSQGVVGLTYQELCVYYPGVQFNKEPADDGVIFYTEYDCSNFSYFVPNGESTILFTINFPKNRDCMNMFVEKYNRNYVIVSKNKWLAYLEDGVVMTIEMKWSDDTGQYIFLYTAE